MDEPAVTRHPLGLPAGSVRAALSLMIAALFWTLLLIPAEKNIPVPLFLYFLSAMVLLFFFAHGKSISADEDDRPPWGLPRGTIRVLIVLGTAAAFGAHYYLYGHSPLAKLSPQPAQLANWPALSAAMLGGLVLGWLIGHGPWRRSPVFQDLQAWVSLLAMLGLVVEVVILLFVNPNLEQSLKIDLATWEAVLTGIIAWYFGARS